MRTWLDWRWCICVTKSMSISLSAAQFRRAAEIKDKIAGLESELNRLLGESVAVKPVSKKRKKLSAATRKKMAAAQQARREKDRAAKK